MIEFYKDDSREWRWRIKAANGKIVATSSEGYASKAMAKNGLAVAIRILFAHVLPAVE